MKILKLRIENVQLRIIGTVQSDNSELDNGHWILDIHNSVTLSLCPLFLSLYAFGLLPVNND